MGKILYIILISCIGLTFMISCSSEEESSSSSFYITEDISFDPSSVPDNATSVAFGQSYQYQVNIDNNYSGTIEYSLSKKPDNMTISSSGMIEWTPTKASQITTHSNITITITTASGYVLTQTYDLTVTGECTSGNVLAIWTGDQRTSTDSSKFLGNITAYTDNASSGDVCGVDNASDCTAENNYQYNQPILKIPKSQNIKDRLHSKFIKSFEQWNYIATTSRSKKTRFIPRSSYAAFAESGNSSRDLLGRHF